MIKAAVCNVKNLDLTKSYPLLSSKRRRKVDKYRFNKDKKLSAGAYLLLIKMLDEADIKDPIFKEGEYGKLYIENYDGIYFNLSHSREIVACVVSSEDVGVDIEYNDCNIDLDIAKRYFFNSEYRNIINSDNSSDTFFNYWVLKESYMKYTGLGFQLNLDSFEVIIDEKIKLKEDENIKFSLFTLNDYKLAVASTQDVKKVFRYDVNELY